MAALLQGKIAVITGAGSGVGRAACLIFAQHGAKVTAADVNAAAAEETAAMVRAAGGEALGLACDVGDEAAVTDVVARTVAAYGRLDIIYNNAGITILPTAQVYGSSKGAITILTRTLAIELAEQGIRINSVCPAGMPTNFIPGLASSDAAKSSMGAAHPLGRFIAPEDCANAALFLASPLSSYIVGQTLVVDGGLIL